MAYNRAERFSKRVYQTGPFVGPGAYDAVDFSKPPRDLGCQYPFLVGAERKTGEISKDAFRFPGPAAYYPKASKRHIPGGVSIDFTEQRFNNNSVKYSRSAGYDLGNDFLESCHGHEGTCKRPLGKIHIGPPPRSLILTGVSVPSRRDVNGYDINQFGTLVKNPPEEKHPPDFYDIPTQEVNFNTRRYKGNFWSRMSGRQDSPTFSTPGPGTYELEVKPSLGKIHNEKLKELKRASSRVPRYLDALCSRKVREDFPGPNSYDPPKGPFDFHQQCECEDYTPKPPPFGQGAKRFPYSSEDTPGPGIYISKKSAGLRSYTCASFGSHVPRFKEKCQDSFPGPGDYYTGREDLAYKWKSRCKRSCPRIPVRGSDTLSKIEKVDLRDFGISQDFKSKKTRVHHAVFRSTVERFRPTVISGNPDPTTYEASLAFNAVTNPRDFRCCKLSAVFASGTSRLAKPTERYTPAPGIYELSRDISEDVKGGVIARGGTADRGMSQNPGPLDYRLDPSVASSVLKKSFNVTLGESRPPKDGAKEEQRDEKGHFKQKKKTLRWFAVPLHTYEHCVRRCDV